MTAPSPVYLHVRTILQKLKERPMADHKTADIKSIRTADTSDIEATIARTVEAFGTREPNETAQMQRKPPTTCAQVAASLNELLKRLEQTRSNTEALRRTLTGEAITQPKEAQALPPKPAHGSVFDALAYQVLMLAHVANAIDHHIEQARDVLK